jgi:hypothetical protein
VTVQHAILLQRDVKKFHLPQRRMDRFGCPG